MVEAEYEARIEAPAAAVWEFIRWDNMEAMAEGGFFASVDYAERRPQPGAIRRITLGDGGRLVEELERCDMRNFLLAYRMLETGPVPIKDYRGEVHVVPDGEDACTIRFRSTCAPQGMDAAAWRAQYAAMQEGNVAFIRSKVETAA